MSNPLMGQRPEHLFPIPNDPSQDVAHRDMAPYRAFVAIRDNPGLRTSEIAKILTASATPRQVESAIYRLVLDGKVRIGPDSRLNAVMPPENRKIPQEIQKKGIGPIIEAIYDAICKSDLPIAIAIRNACEAAMPQEMAGADVLLAAADHISLFGFLPYGSIPLDCGYGCRANALDTIDIVAEGKNMAWRQAVYFLACHVFGLDFNSTSFDWNLIVVRIVEWNRQPMTESYVVDVLRSAAQEALIRAGQ